MKQAIISVMLAMVCVVILGGCSYSVSRYDAVFQRYNMTELKINTSADVLSWIQDPSEHLSQSESVVASWRREGPKDRTSLFNMVAFDEEKLYAVRKYGFVVEETHWGWNRTPAPALRLDAELIMDPDVLGAPYANNNEKYIQILKKVREQFHADAAEVNFDSDVFRNASMMVNQVLNSALVKLDNSPAYAADLPKLEGMAFDHSIFGESRIRMLIEDDRVKLKIKSGKAWFKSRPFEEQPDVIGM